MLYAHKKKREKKEMFLLEQESFQSIIENLASGVVVIDTEAKVVFLNPAGEKILAMKWDEVQGKHLDEIMIPINEEHNPLLLTLYKGEEVHRRKIQVKLANGRELILGLSTIPLWGRDKQLKGVGAIFTDLTQQEAVEREMQRLQHLARLGEMLSWIAHEFKNPLTSIKLGLTTLKERLEISEQDKKFFETILSELDRMNSSLKEILHFSRPCNYERVKPYPVYEIVERALFLLKPQLEQCNVKVEVECADHSIKAICDPTQLEQVFINLIMNAIQAMPAGGGLKIEINRCKEELKRKPSLTQNLVEISFIDSGVGISPDDLDRIFEPFYTTKRFGTGLGLAIARKIVEEVGGEIIVQSQPGLGSTFTVRLLAPSSEEEAPSCQINFVKPNLSPLFSQDSADKHFGWIEGGDGGKKNINC